jgi:hypothetical protein
MKVLLLFLCTNYSNYTNCSNYLNDSSLTGRLTAPVWLSANGGIYWDSKILLTVQSFLGYPGIFLPR